MSELQSYTFENITLAYLKTGSGTQPVLWGHGWGQSHHAFLKLIQPLEKKAQHYVFDFPGFGESSLPPETWDTKDYAGLIASFIKDNNLGPVIWIGHSFGGRVGLQLAAHHPALLSGIVLIASAGLQKKRTLLQNLYIRLRILTYKTLKHIIPYGPQQLGFTRERLIQIFGSADFANAVPLRQVIRNFITEDLTEQARQVKCPALIIYGENDTETPPEMGQRLHALIPESKMVLIPGEDHYSVLDAGRHQVVPHIKKFIEGIQNP